MDGVHYSSWCNSSATPSFSITTASWPRALPPPLLLLRSPPPKPTSQGSMSNSFFGLITLVATVMLMTWDNFFGLGWLSLKCISKAYDWNEAYVPLLKKILPHIYREAEADQEEDEEKRPMLEMNNAQKK